MLTLDEIVAVLAIAALVTLLAVYLSLRLRASRQRLRDSEARFSDFADIAADWFWEIDADLRYTYLSERYEETTGIPRDRVIGRQRGYVLGEAGVEDEELHRQQELIAARKPFRGERRTRDAEGREHVYVSEGRPIYDQRGRFRGYRGIGRDITAQREREQRLRQAAAVFDSSAEAVIITDPEERIERVNRAFNEMTGYRDEEVVGRSMDSLRSESARLASNEAIREALETEGEWRGEARVWNRDGGVHAVWACISEVRDDHRRPVNYAWFMLDISELKQYQARLERLAHHDALTDLPNRALFESRLDQALERARRHKLQLAVLFLDFDGFKKVNDTRGHAAGDAVLREVARRLTERLRASDTVARISGDEFLAVLDDISSQYAAARVAAELTSLLSEPFCIEDEETFLTVSIGVALFPRDARDVQSLIGHADAAMYRAKEEGGHRYCLYAEEMSASLQRHRQVERRLRRALERSELALHYQPQFCLTSGALVGAEALARWEDADLGKVGPDEFIAVAENSAMIEALELWVMHTACNQCQAWAERGLTLDRMAVNVSGREVERGTLATSVRGVLAMTGVAAERLELELIESYLMRGPRMAETLASVRETGIRLAVDDFGTGYSSLAYLRSLPVGVLKIDRSFVARLDREASERAIVAAIVTMAHSLDMTVVAEGVETQAQLDMVREIGCDVAQGYLLGHPLPPNEFLERFGAI
jgi:diguanylate cyclase (GGDEF)-like protein/PAS domain S-box-containing protein